MSEKKAYPLRINAEVLAAAQRWADDENVKYDSEDMLRALWRPRLRLRMDGGAVEIRKITVDDT